MALALIALLLQLFGQPANGVSVSTDMASYTPGDPIQATIQNVGPDTITRGGIACDDVWPLALEQLQADATWQAVPVHRRGNCIGITGVLVQPGQSQAHTLSLSRHASYQPSSRP